MKKLYSFQTGGAISVKIEAKNAKEVKTQLNKLDNDTLAHAMVFIGNFKSFMEPTLESIRQKTKQDNMLSVKKMERFKNNAALVGANVIVKLMSAFTVPTMRKVCAGLVKERGIENQVRKIDNEYQALIKERDVSKSH